MTNINTNIINETAARQSKNNMSFGEYKPGSATSEYNQEISRVKALIESAKTRVSPEAQKRLDRLALSYAAKYATWTNARNANGAGHVSVMIAGPSNYNIKKHEAYLKRESKLWAEYEEFKNIDYKIQSIIRGDKVIKSSDSSAIEKLEAKLEGLQAAQERMKAINAIVRKKKLTDDDKISELIKIGISEESAKKELAPDFCGRVGYTYHLQNNNGNMRNIKLRIDKLKRDQERGTIEEVINPTTGEGEEKEEVENGIRIVDNVEAARLQIFFPGKPDADTRAKLKSNGFRWAPSIGAWQSYRNRYAMEKAKQIINQG